MMGVLAGTDRPGQSDNGIALRGKKAISMRERAGGAITRASARTFWESRKRAAAFVACVAVAAPLLSGCAVSDSDINRWEFTEQGPDIQDPESPDGYKPGKLRKVMVHEKFSWDLRVDAALALIRMKPRSGRHVGLESFLRGMRDQKNMTPDARKRMVADLVPKIIPQMDQHAPPPNADGTLPPDPSVPYKDAAFALVTESGLTTDDAIKQQLTEALVKWVQTDFELRIDNRIQQYSIEQMDRTLKEPAVKALPALIREDGPKNDQIVALIAELGDIDAKKAASAQLVALAQKMDSKEWFEKQRPLVEESNRRANTPASPDQVTQQIKDYQKGQLEPVFGWLKKIGQRPAVEFCLSFGGDKSKNADLRKQALAALENNVDKNNASDVDRIFKIFADDTNPDDIRGLSLARLAELSKEQVVPKLYSVFGNFKIRLDAGQKLIEILKPMDAKAVDDFMNHLPKTNDQKMKVNEGIAFGANIAASGDDAKKALRKYVSSKDVGPRLVAIGSFYQAPKADASLLKSAEDDTGTIFKCDDADRCGTCATPKKEGGVDMKDVKTFGDFTKICVEPWMK